MPPSKRLQTFQIHYSIACGGHVVRETDDKIVIFGHYDDRFDIPKSEIAAAGRSVLSWELTFLGYYKV